MRTWLWIIAIGSASAGCLEDPKQFRPKPRDLGIEDNFDARVPPAMPGNGSGAGYGSGYSSGAPQNPSSEAEAEPTDGGQSSNEWNNDVLESDASVGDLGL